MSNRQFVAALSGARKHRVRVLFGALVIAALVTLLDPSAVSNLALAAPPRADNPCPDAQKQTPPPPHSIPPPLTFWHNVLKTFRRDPTAMRAAVCMR